jgi:hypothetical protein
MVVVNDTFYISSLQCVFKTDKYLNLIYKYNLTGFAFTSIYYNSTNNLIYVVSSVERFIYMYSIDFVDVVGTIDVSPYIPWLVLNY